jgi:hypothetical protein
MFDREMFGLIANGAAIVTAVIAALAFAQFHWARRSRRVRLERTLKRGVRERKPWRTVLGLAIELGIPEAEIVDASYRSRKIDRLPLNDFNGAAVKMLLAYRSPESSEAVQEAISIVCKPDGGMAGLDFLPNDYRAGAGESRQ